MEYAYKARSREGKVVEGSRSAPDTAAVVDWLRRQEMTPLTIVEGRGKPSGGGRGGVSSPLATSSRGEGLLDRLNRLSTISIRDKAVFFRQLSTMMSSGLTLASALDILKDQTKNKRLAYAVVQVKKMLDNGVSLAAAMKSRPEFNTLMVAMVQAGEEGGLLDVTVDRLASFLEKQENLQRKIKGALTYPTVIMTFATLVLYLMVTVIVPKFKGALDNLNAELPWITTVIFDLADFFGNKWYIILGAIVALGAIWMVLGSSKATRPFVDKVRLRVPVFGDLQYKAIMARSTRTMGSLVQAGVPILSCLEMAGEVSDNYEVRQGFAALREAAKRGQGLGETAKGLKIFPLMVAHMIAIGEQTGRLEEMMNKVADWFEGELDVKVGQLNSLLEPMLIVFVGGVVASGKEAAATVTSVRGPSTG
ncbi:MAG: Type II secretion system protein F [Synergistetes bacterium ADurb.Bin520]|nr:MAG: Type II secretion system protein F [Synergistetes bacterium ADurb.Bin520]